MGKRRAAYDAFLRGLPAAAALTAEEERRLVPLAKAGDPDARDRVIRSHIRMIGSVAWRHRGRGVAVMDLISEGCVGFLEALGRTDPDAVARLSTYAWYSVTSAIMRAVAEDPFPIRIPRHLRRDISKSRRDPAYFGRLPRGRQETVTVAALAARAGAIQDDYTLGRVEDHRGRIGPSGGETREKPDHLDPEGIRGRIDASLHVLTGRELSAFARRYGFCGYDAYGIGRVALMLRCPREDVEALLLSATGKIRRHILACPDFDPGRGPPAVEVDAARNVKVSPRDVPEFRRMLAARTSHGEIADRFGLPRATVGRLAIRLRA